MRAHIKNVQPYSAVHFYVVRNRHMLAELFAIVIGYPLGFSHQNPHIMKHNRYFNDTRISMIGILVGYVTSHRTLKLSCGHSNTELQFSIACYNMSVFVIEFN